MSGGKGVATLPESTATVAVHRSLTICELFDRKANDLRMAQRLKAQEPSFSHVIIARELAK
jgi:hypothetical protein